MSTELSSVVLLGDPVAHSISPAMHNAAFRALGLPLRYSARRVAVEDLPEAVTMLGDAAYVGANVTVPHKVSVARLLTVLNENARAVGAVNTIVRRGLDLIGDNTDIHGLLAALQYSLGVSPYGQRILLLGAGGAARAASVAVLSSGAAALTIYNRHIDRAESLATTMKERYGGRVRAVGEDAARAEAEDVDLIINATSAGLDGDSMPLDHLQPRPGAALYDMVYGTRATPLMRAVAATGTPVADGLAMLVFQAAASFALWTGQDAPLDVMRQAAETELRRRREETA